MAAQCEASGAAQDLAKCAEGVFPSKAAIPRLVNAIVLEWHTGGNAAFAISSPARMDKAAAFSSAFTRVLRTSAPNQRGFYGKKNSAPDHSEALNPAENLMFHTYVLVHAQDPIKGGKKLVDIDRASFLMDKTLLAQSIKAMNDERDNNPRHDAIYGAQWIWDFYCERHYEKYGQAFTPDVDPNWDQ